MNYTKLCLLVTGSLTFLFVTPAQAVNFVNTLSIPGETPDLYPIGNGAGGANINRLGMFSDLYYDRAQNVYYGLSDRGPGGGVIPYQTRVEKFTLDVNPNTGALSNFNIEQTILFTQNGQSFNGLNPQLLNGNPNTLGLSFDPEGFVVSRNGNFYVSDEYGPSVYEFNPNGSFIRALTIPGNILPRQADGTPNYMSAVTGRQDNRGFEGLAISPDGSKLYGMLQDPLVNEGNPEGRYSRNLRLVEFDTQTGESTRQFIYQLESIADINAGFSNHKNDDFKANAQGRNIGISAIAALNDAEFLVLERDNRGFGVEAPTLPSNPPVGTKKVYKISLADATDVSKVNLTGINDLPLGVNPVSKSLFLDIASSLKGAGPIIPEKLEGLTIGPQLANGDYAVIVGSDNDFSVTQNSSNVQFNVCTNGTTADSKVALSSPCPTGLNLIPGYLLSFKVTQSELGNFVPPEAVPEPLSIFGIGTALSFGTFFKRKLSQKAEQ
ncbi:PEP-CTERM sorting domain-containing protein [Gloeothece verrucosa]|uniref:Phytase-like domain-containing protein n=1 Tax=Gloeothece verrucosa (strain PCC 7822) TaxID=497965 RepID=E0UC21_GLOV7|nr:PEP-CTERM sorting domain-containing protein [Gloeothece verrucosa]ADN16359.1 protein of unknown function DUF1555 [Gloeothece verrucosa PCC 7822]